MKRIILNCCIALLCCCTACKKELVVYHPAVEVDVVPQQSPKPYVAYTIKQGEQYCDKNNLAPAQYDVLNFWVKFDSTAIYTNSVKENQLDINKLYGFSDNNADHHAYSARFGWRWSDNALRLFGYVYNDSIRSSMEIGTVNIGTENFCSIKVAGNKYVFMLNDKTLIMPRTSKTPKGMGYKLYPYFGGDELAPHQITIFIKELSE